MLLIYEGDAGFEAASAVACFKAPRHIMSVRRNGRSICVGCLGGAVCILQDSEAGFPHFLINICTPRLWIRLDV